MYVFKEINKSSTLVEYNVVNYTQNLNTSSLGIESIKIVSGSISSSYWSSLNVLFYTSGSPVYAGETKFNNPASNFSENGVFKIQHLNKFHGYPSQSIVTIPSTYYGESIKRKSFKLTDLNNSDNNNINPIIVDDGKGNLYSTNAHHSQSTNNASSSDNYVGNIFYNLGMVVLNETGSWSGSVNYSDLATNYLVKFSSVNTITTREYNVTLLPNEFNNSMNYTLRSPISGSLNLSTPYLAKEFTGSNFQPYITTINLYQDGEYDVPVIQAKLAKPVTKSKKINTVFKIRLDI